MDCLQLRSVDRDGRIRTGRPPAPTESNASKGSTYYGLFLIFLPTRLR